MILGFDIHVEFSSLIEKYTTLKKKNKLMLEENNFLKCELETLRNKNDSCMHKFNSLQNDMHDMKNDLDACKLENENLKLKIISLESSIASNDMLRLEKSNNEKKHDSLILKNNIASNDKGKIKIISQKPLKKKFMVNASKKENNLHNHNLVKKFIPRQAIRYASIYSRKIRKSCHDALKKKSFLY